MLTIAGLLSRHARYRPHHTALVFGEERLDYRTLNAQVNRLANGLRAAGLHKGDRLATLLPNGVELLALYWATAKLGAVVVPLSPLLQGPALVGLLRDSGSSMLVLEASFADVIRPLRGELPGIPEENFVLVGEAEGFRPLNAILGDTSEPPDAKVLPEDLYDIVYSSGTTGEPKGIMHSHLVRANYATLLANSWRMAPESVVLHTGSIVFNGAFVTLMPAFFCGCTYVLEPYFDPGRFIQVVEAEQVTHVMLVPSQIIALLHHPEFSVERLASLEMILSLGAPLHRVHTERLHELLPRRFHELYGLTEGFWTILDRDDAVRKLGSVGVPPPLFEMRIVDEQGVELPPGAVGEICGRGPVMTPGYYGKPELSAATIRDGWLYTGDLGRVDEDGFLYLVDRQKDMIISGGVNVYPTDIEAVVSRHPAVREVAVYGVPDDRWGESPVAAVVLDDTAEETAETLRGWINQQVSAKYQRVREVLILDDLPRNVAGKTLKRVLRERHLGN